MVNQAKNTSSTVPTLPETGFVRLPVILALFPIGKTSWWNGCKTGKYPAPVKLSDRITAWRVEDIKKLIESYNEVNAA